VATKHSTERYNITKYQLRPFLILIEDIEKGATEFASTIAKAIQDIVREEYVPGTLVALRTSTTYTRSQLDLYIYCRIDIAGKHKPVVVEP
jgi:hypothetical protein